MFSKDLIGDLQRVISPAFVGADDGELYIERCSIENIELESSTIKNISINSSQGFGLRKVVEESIGYAHSSEISKQSVEKAVEALKTSFKGNACLDKFPVTAANHCFYPDSNYLSQLTTKQKVDFLSSVDIYVRSLDSRVKQVTVSVTGNVASIQIIRPDGLIIDDTRPILDISIVIIVSNGCRQESASSRFGGRCGYDNFFDENFWKPKVKQALDRAISKLDSVPAPVGNLPVILGSGWAGVLLHEAIGHGLEGDAVRKKSSVFFDMLGQDIASPLVTICDDGTVPLRRGSANFDDEGTPTQKTVLVDGGKLVGFMYDRLNARLMHTASTGNGRRQNYKCCPIPRMTNTFMYGGETSQEEMVHSVKRGVLALSFDGGQVDTASGKFVFIASDAYLVENGQIKCPIKGASLIGHGPEILKKIKMIGNDFAFDDGVGTCGKSGQNVPVGVGQPSILIDQIVIGGTA